MTKYVVGNDQQLPRSSIGSGTWIRSLGASRVLALASTYITFGTWRKSVLPPFFIGSET